MALRPVDGFPGTPWVPPRTDVTPPTTMAAADSCLRIPGRQISPDKVRILAPDPCCVYMRLLWRSLGFTVFGQLTPHPMPLYAVLVHQVQVLHAGFLPTPVCTRRSCLRLVVRRANAHRRLSLPRFRPCWAYQQKRPTITVGRFALFSCWRPLSRPPHNPAARSARLSPLARAGTLPVRLP